MNNYYQKTSQVMRDSVVSALQQIEEMQNTILYEQNTMMALRMYKKRATITSVSLAICIFVKYLWFIMAEL